MKENFKGHEEEASTPPELITNSIAKVEKMLEKHFPDHLKFDEGNYTITRGSTQVMIVVRPFTRDETCVEFFSHVASKADINNELMRFLLRKNAELHFGAFGLLFDDTIVFSHSIAGTNMDDNEFTTALNSVAVIADHYDDVIVEMAGGLRALDDVDEDMLEN
ncbi:MAG: T3SS (YopN, CesT) and YbjN peptide-binding chaperone 1 [Candidatus Kapaibacterium sp.]